MSTSNVRDARNACRSGRRSGPRPSSPRKTLASELERHQFDLGGCDRFMIAPPAAVDSVNLTWRCRDVEVWRTAAVPKVQGRWRFPQQAQRPFSIPADSLTRLSESSRTRMAIIFRVEPLTLPASNQSRLRVQTQSSHGAASDHWADSEGETGYSAQQSRILPEISRSGGYSIHPTFLFVATAKSGPKRIRLIRCGTATSPQAWSALGNYGSA